MSQPEKSRKRKHGSVFASILNKLDELTPEDTTKLHAELTLRIRAQNASTIEAEVEKTGFCVAPYGTESKYSKITTYLPAMPDANGVVRLCDTTVKYGVPWAKTLGYDVTKFDLSSYRKSDVQASWPRPDFDRSDRAPGRHRR